MGKTPHTQGATLSWGAGGGQGPGDPCCRGRGGRKLHSDSGQYMGSASTESRGGTVPFPLPEYSTPILAQGEGTVTVFLLLTL